MKQKSYFKQWVLGIPYELAFWNNIYRWKSSFESLRNWSRLGKVLELEGMDASTFLSDFDSPIVFDVGCGMSYAKGNHIKRAEGIVPIEVHYIDPLAHFYNDIKKRHHRDMPDVQFGMMEYLSTVVNPNTVSLVIIHNALDHSANPMKGILSALNVLSIGGCLYLNHHPNEAEAENYKGFHKFNICIDNNQCIIWNKNERIVVDDIISKFATIETKTLDNGFIVSIIKKTAQVEHPQINPLLESRELANLLFEQIETSKNLSFVLKMNIKYWWFNTIHFFVQLLSYENRMRLRKLVYRK